MDRVNSTSNRNWTKRQTAARDFTRSELIPPPPDEAYWAALLQEGEELAVAAPRHERDWEHTLDGLLTEGNGRTSEQNRADWQAIEQIYRTDQVVTLPVIGYNRGGLLVEWRSLRGFVPASQLIDFPAVNDGAARRHELAQRVGKMLRLRVIELDYAQNRLILSERAAQVQPGTRASILETLQRGDICEGQVTNLCDFGAFVDLGGVEGLIHISELSWGRVGHPRDILSRGEKVKVYVMDVQREQGRVALSLKRLQPDPWATVAQRYHVGQIVEGVITNVVDFGAFARVEEGLEGLIHVSELAEGNFLHPRNVVREGERVRARVLNIDGNARRLGLSLRRLNGDLAERHACEPHLTEH
ncbi:MAG: S1 RNA-binding domain-containing protein [Anaerolineae bacterium]|nr:S1 RNA-binding domain-containing protein [Anaerolineae bacterium]MDW8299562.1 S1 RNA-binding domain-containing protein [Anaerolineae bacterium]